MCLPRFFSFGTRFVRVYDAVLYYSRKFIIMPFHFVDFLSESTLPWQRLRSLAGKSLFLAIHIIRNSGKKGTFLLGPKENPVSLTGRQHDTDKHRSVGRWYVTILAKEEGQTDGQKKGVMRIDPFPVPLSLLFPSPHDIYPFSGAVT